MGTQQSRQAAAAVPSGAHCCRTDRHVVRHHPRQHSQSSLSSLTRSSDIMSSSLVLSCLWCWVHSALGPKEGQRKKEQPEELFVLMGEQHALFWLYKAVCECSWECEPGLCRTCSEQAAPRAACRARQTAQVPFTPRLPCWERGFAHPWCTQLAALLYFPPWEGQEHHTCSRFYFQIHSNITEGIIYSLSVI